MRKEAPATTAKHLRKYITLALRRLIVALLIGSLPLDTADRLAGARNSPHHIGELRYKFHLSIYTEYVERIDRDGHGTRPGICYLQPDARGLACTQHQVFNRMTVAVAAPYVMDALPKKR